MENDARLERGKAIAEKRHVRRAPDGSWVVLSQTLPRTRYKVDAKQQTCTCPDFEAWEMPCKHVFAVRFFQGLALSTSQGSPTPQQNEKKHDEEHSMRRPTYPQKWTAYNAAQINERDLFERLLKELCDTVKNPRYEGGRPRLAMATVIFSATMKVYTTMSGRRASTDIRRCKEDGYIDHAPHHNSVSRYLLDPKLTPILTRLIELSATPLSAVETQFAVDATGFSTNTYSRWFDHKYGRTTQKQRWVKCHAMVGTRTNIVTAVKVTEALVSDATEMTDLVAASAKNFDLKEVSADKAYLSQVNLLAIEGAGAEPFIPFKSNSVKNRLSAWQRMWHCFWYRRTEFLQHYHRRSNVETTFSMIKAKFGGSVRSKKPESQFNEVLCKILAHNIVVLIHEMFELGIDPGFAKEDGPQAAE